MLDVLFDPFVWIGIGVALLAAEMIVPGYVLLGFGIGAIMTGAGLFFLRPEAGTILVTDVLYLLVIYGLLALTSWWVLWRRLGQRSRRARRDHDINDFNNRL